MNQIRKAHISHAITELQPSQRQLGSISSEPGPARPPQLGCSSAEPGVADGSSCAVATLEIYVVLDILMGFLDLVIYPFVHLGSSDVSQEDKGSFQRVVHGSGSSVEPMVDLPLGHEPIHLCLITIKNFWFVPL